MLIVFICAILAIASLALIVIGKVDYPEYSDPDRKINLRPWGIGLAVLTALIFTIASFKVVEPGHVAIPVAFGTVGEPKGDGVHLVAPWTDFKDFSTRSETFILAGDGNVEHEDGPTVEVKGKDGAGGWVDAALIYRVSEADAGRLYGDVGTNFEDKIISTTLRTCIREASIGYTMVDAATVKRSDLEGDIEACARDKIEPRGIIIEDFQLRNITVTEAVQAAMNEKVAAEQEALRKNMELQSTAAEAEKRRIEAKGLADSEQIIKCGATVTTIQNDDGTVTEAAIPKSDQDCENNLTPEYLQLQYIQALEEMARNGNATVVVPTDENLTPLLQVPAGK